MSGGFPHQLISIGVAAGVAGVLAAARAVSRRHTIGHGKEARATIMHVERSELRASTFSQPYLLVQVAIPRGDGTEIVAVAKVGDGSFDTMLQPGLTVPVYYRERLGSTTMVEIVGPPSRAAKADPPA